MRLGVPVQIARLRNYHLGLMGMVRRWIGVGVVGTLRRRWWSGSCMISGMWLMEGKVGGIYLRVLPMRRVGVGVRGEGDNFFLNWFFFLFFQMVVMAFQWLNTDFALRRLLRFLFFLERH